MSLIDPEKVKQLLNEFNEKEAVTKAEIYEIERQVAELEARIDESRSLLANIAEDREVILGMRAEYGSDDWAHIALKVGAEIAARGGKRGVSFLTGYKPVKSKSAPVQVLQAQNSNQSSATAVATVSAPAPAPSASSGTKDKARTSQSKLAAIVNRDVEEKAKKNQPQAPAPAKAQPPYEDSLASVLVQAIGSEPVGSTPSESSSDENPSLFLFSHPKTENKDVDIWSLTPSVSWADLGDEIPPDATDPEPAPAKPVAEPVHDLLPAPEPVPLAPAVVSNIPAPMPETINAQPAAATTEAPVTIPPSAFEPMPESGPTPFLDDDEFTTSEMADEMAAAASQATVGSGSDPSAAALPPADLIAQNPAPAEKKDEAPAAPAAEAEEDVKKINDALRGLFNSG